MLHGDTFFLDDFAVRQWDDPNYSGTRISYDKAAFVETVHRLFKEGGSKLVDGYAPFCKHGALAGWLWLGLSWLLAWLGLLLLLLVMGVMVTSVSRKRRLQPHGGPATAPTNPQPPQTHTNTTTHTRTHTRTHTT